MRLSETAGTVLGKPASSTASRPMFAPCSPAWVTVPQTTSSIRAGSIPARDATPCSACARRESGRESRNAPPRRPNGVRSAARMTGTAMGSADGRWWRRLCATVVAPAASLLRAFGALGAPGVLGVLGLVDLDEFPAVAQQRIDRRLRHQHGPPGDRLLTRELGGERLLLVGERLVGLVLVLGLLVTRRLARLGDGAGHARAHVIAVVGGRLADLQLVGPALEGCGPDRGRVVEAGIRVAHAGRGVGDLQRVQRARRVVRLLQVERAGTGELPLGVLLVLRHRPLLLAVRRERR